MKGTDLMEPDELIEQDADVVMFVYRGEYYKEREKPAEHNLEAMAQWQEEMDIRPSSDCSSSHLSFFPSPCFSFHCRIPSRRCSKY